MSLIKYIYSIFFCFTIFHSSELRGQWLNSSENILYSISQLPCYFIDFNSNDTLTFDEVYNKIHQREIYFIDCFSQDGWSNFEYFEGGYKSAIGTTIELIEIRNYISESEDLIIGKIFAENGDFVKYDTLFRINNRYHDNIDNIITNDNQLNFGRYKLTGLQYNEKVIELDSCLNQKTLIILPNNYFIQFFGGYTDECKCEAFEIESNRHYKLDVLHSVSNIIHYYLSPNNVLYLFDESKDYLQKIILVYQDNTNLIFSNEDGYTLVYTKQD
ncbi:MAG: hypothetical protein R2787_03120 [Saprospiraceae bacterium]